MSKKGVTGRKRGGNRTSRKLKARVLFGVTREHHDGKWDKSGGT